MKTLKDITPGTTVGHTESFTFNFTVWAVVRHETQRFGNFTILLNIDTKEEKEIMSHTQINKGLMYGYEEMTAEMWTRERTQPEENEELSEYLDSQHN